MNFLYQVWTNLDVVLVEQKLKIKSRDRRKYTKIEKPWRVLSRRVGIFLFYFVLLKQRFYKKTVDFNRIRTQIVGVESKHADH